MDQKPLLLIVDVTCPKEYDPGTLLGASQGGTESTVTRVAEGLSQSGHMDVTVWQHNRLDTHQAGACYTREKPSRAPKWVVVLRDPRPMVEMRERYPNAKIFLWSHDIADRNLGLHFDSFLKSGCAANICVSDWHRTQTIDTLKIFGYSGQFRMRHIYNPLAEGTEPYRGPYDKNKLVWLSSPHKGLAKAYEIFKLLLRQNPNFKLYVTNPGYFETLYTEDPEVKAGTVVLGTVPHSEALAQLQGALCLFYPNTVFPETFGMVMSEANAIGTPVLTHPIGASREVLDRHPEQLIDCRDTQKVVERIMKWHNGARPIVRGMPNFKITRIVAEWVKLLKDIR